MFHALQFGLKFRVSVSLSPPDNERFMIFSGLRFGSFALTEQTLKSVPAIHFSLFEALSVHCSNISVAGTHTASKGLRLIIFCCEFSADPFNLANSWGAFELKTIIVCYGRGTLPLVSLTRCLKARFSLAKTPELGHWSVCSVKVLRFDRIVSQEPEWTQSVVFRLSDTH